MKSFFLVCIASALILAGAAGCQTAMTSDSLSGDWDLIELGGKPVELAEAEKPPTISFDDDRQRVEGFAGCNTYFGDYVLAGSSLTFGPLGSTRMACPGSEENIETAYLASLRQTTAWRIKGGKLQLLAKDVILARFKPAP